MKKALIGKDRGEKITLEQGWKSIRPGPAPAQRPGPTRPGPGRAGPEVKIRSPAHRPKNFFRSKLSNFDKYLSVIYSKNVQNLFFWEA